MNGSAGWDATKTWRWLVNLLTALLAVLPPVVALWIAWPEGTIYTGVGDVIAIDAAKLQVTISHEEIPQLMPAMTMAFPVRSAAVLADVRSGSLVRFDVLRRGDELLVTRLLRIGDATGGRPGFHDHTPHHGGVVSMWGMLHVEVAAASDGHVRVYFSDVWRRPLAPTGWSGTATLDLPDGAHTLSLIAVADVLEAVGPSIVVDTVLAHVRVQHSAEPIELHVLLPVHTQVSGAALVAIPKCLAPQSPTDGGRLPLCDMAFPSTITAVAATPEHAVALVAILNAGVTAWQLPSGELSHGFAPLPPIVVAPEHPPHGESASAIVVKPDGTEAVIVQQARLARYTLATGQLIRELPRFGGVVRSVAWSPDGAQLLVSVFYEQAAHLIRAEDGEEIRRLATEGEAAAVAFSADGRVAAIGSEVGPIAIYDLTTTTAPRLVHDTLQAVNSLVVVGRRLFSAGVEGVLRAWDLDTGARLWQHPIASPCTSIAVAPGGRVAVIAGRDRALRLYDLDSGELIETLGWHRAGTLGLAWAGSMLVSGDAEGHLALWNLADRIDQSMPDGARP